MREILFRGKKKDGEWVYGDLIPVLWDKPNILDRNSSTDLDIYEATYSVNPKTVGQYTGLLDKNGNKIFEGDIIQYGKNLYIVEYHVEIGATVCVRTNDVDHWPSFNVGTIKHTEIVGNIHDNPELLEVQS